MADLPADQIAPLFSNVKMICQAIEEALGAEGSFVAVNNRVSQSVPHMHVHIVPRRRKDGLRGFFWPRGKYHDDSERESIRTSLWLACERLKQSHSA
jgi:histidine triad (HIT) family protein